jgi:DNA primase
MATRYDFKHVRENADFQTILNHYGIETKKDGTKAGQVKALCPFHDDTKPSLKVNLERKIYHCFPCEAKGNVLDFVMAREGCEIREAAKIVVDVCGISPNPNAIAGQKKRNPTPPARQAKPETPAPAPVTTSDAEADGVPYNKPLDFELKLTRPPELMDWLAERGITDEMADQHGLGMASNKSKTIGGRLAIPLRDESGVLLGYCGRYLGDASADDVPKYVLPKQFRKELLVYGLAELKKRWLFEGRHEQGLFVVESYLSVIKHGDHVPMISMMGRSISQAQIDLIKDLPFRAIIAVSDGDEPGREGARDIAGAVAPHRWTRVVDMPDDQKPHHMTPEELHAYLGRETMIKKPT